MMVSYLSPSLLCDSRESVVERVLQFHRVTKDYKQRLKGGTTAHAGYPDCGLGWLKRS